MSKYHTILGISSNSTKNEVRKAYHKLALIYHPDRPNGNQKKFLEIKEAYESLITMSVHSNKKYICNVITAKFIFEDYFIDLDIENVNVIYTYPLSSDFIVWDTNGNFIATLVITKSFLINHKYKFTLKVLYNNGMSINLNVTPKDSRSKWEKFKDFLINLFK